MKPLIHAESSVVKFGGKREDYIAIHQFFDSTKAHLGDNRHRAILHNSFGIFLCEQVFGLTIINSDGNEVSVRDIGEQHVLEDLGFIPSISDYLSLLPSKPWMNGSRKEQKKEGVYDGSLEEILNKNPFQSTPLIQPPPIISYPDPKDDRPMPPFTVTD